jgi:hypothetical protein
MSATAHTDPLHWARIHRAVLTVVVLSMALAAAVALLLTTRLTTTSAPVPATSVSHGQLTPTDNGCQIARPGQAC